MFFVNSHLFIMADVTVIHTSPNGNVVKFNGIPLVQFWETFEPPRINKAEVKLCRFFRCPPTKTRNCCFSTNEAGNFERHLLEKHPEVSDLFCFHCHWQLSNEGRMYYKCNQEGVQSLISHIIICHTQRRYQCNLCVYRAISPKHVYLHQFFRHSGKL